MSTADQTKPTRPTRKPSASPRQLLAITNELTRADSLDAALERLVDLLSLHLNAERSTVFLNDERTGELYSRVAQGEWRREIRMLNNRGVAGWSFTTGEGAIIADAYADERFLDDFDRRTGFKTKSILCAPLRNLNGDIVGASQVLNKKDGQFAESDLALLDAITQQAAIGLQTHLVLEQIEHSRQQEAEFLEVVSSVSSEINLGPLLNKIISAITKMLD
ncbi:MAG: GAF domain-containing protein, partial [Armatimonadetes bacterium]|nr:GAF domain-containing protein [Armatimonadota bacterium]